MGLGHSPSIVTSGLVLCLDAANQKSYPGSGTTWTDLSGTGNHGTLTNGPTFNNDSKGSMALDGVDDSVLCNSSASLAFGTNNFTIQIALKITTVKTNQYFFDFGSNNVVLQYYQPGSGYLIRYLTQNTSIKDTTYTLTQNQIYEFTLVRNGTAGSLFLNANQLNTWTDSETYTSNAPKIGKYGANNTVNLTGNVYYFKTYNRALTAAEIQQNFQAMRGRFGI